MNKTKWNNADKVLAVAGLAFFASLYAVAQYPENIFFQGLHFCIEAALVGGIADWFAVTALFEKPGGFSYHTAILPRRRQEFMNAMVKFIQQEFFSQRKIFSLLDEKALQKNVVAWLKTEGNIKFLQEKLQERMAKEVINFDFSQATNVLATEIRNSIKEIPFRAVFQWFYQQASGEKGEVFLHELAAYLLVKIDTPETQSNIYEFLEKYQQDKIQAQGMMAQFFSGLASAMGVLNLAEAADIIQKNLSKLLLNIATQNTVEQKEIRQAFLQELQILENDENFIAIYENLKNEVASALPLENVIDDCWAEIKKTTQLDVPSGEKSLTISKGANDVSTVLLAYLAELLEQIPDKLLTDIKLQNCFAIILHDASARCVLYAREMSEQIVRTVLEEFSDEKLNQLVYEKVEPDMLWIRMNGSIVGSFVGMVIFILIKLMS